MGESLFSLTLYNFLLIYKSTVNEKLNLKQLKLNTGIQQLLLILNWFLYMKCRTEWNICSFELCNKYNRVSIQCFQSIRRVQTEHPFIG